jgi:hypothetical protein
VPILLFFIFVGMVGFFTLALGYGLSSFEERDISRRRCRMLHGMYHGRRIRRQRRRCRVED